MSRRIDPWRPNAIHLIAIATIGLLVTGFLR